MPKKRINDFPSPTLEIIQEQREKKECGKRGGEDIPSTGSHDKALALCKALKSLWAFKARNSIDPGTPEGFAGGGGGELDDTLVVVVVVGSGTTITGAVELDNGTIALTVVVVGLGEGFRGEEEIIDRYREEVTNRG